MNTTPLATQTTAGRPAHDGVLVEPAWLEAHLHDPAVRVVEVDVSRLAYDDWHIDGAVLWNVYEDLKDADYRTAGRGEVARLAARSGIGPDSTVVFYGYAPAMGLWLMRLYGHADVRILDCSRGTWRAEGHPCSSTPARPAGPPYRLPGEDAGLRADHAAVRSAIGDPRTAILDVRTRDEYVGERFWPSGGMEPGGRAGHVPSAVHQPLGDVYDDRGSFRPPGELRQMFPILSGGGDRELITYCTIGGRASTAWFILTYLLGHDHVRVHDGSWAEWGRLAGSPVERP